MHAVRGLTPAEENVQKLVEAAIARISFAACPFQTEVRLDHDLGKLYTTVAASMPEKSEYDAAQFGDKLPPALASVDHAIEWIYMRVHDVWIHELNEVFLVDGSRRRDLHDEQGDTIPAPEDAGTHALADFKRRLAAFLMDPQNGPT